MRQFAVMSACLLIIIAVVVSIGQHVIPHHPPSKKATTSVSKPVKVMTIGGSVAHGEYDSNAGGYLARTFHYLTKRSDTEYTLYDKTIVGANAVQLQETLYKGSYEKWLSTIKPNVVVISWGLLNDALPKTPKSEFKRYLTLEISEALHQHADVLVITPPVTKAADTIYKKQVQEYINDEISVVRQVSSDNVKLYNLFSQMQRYPKSHHETYVPLSTNSWHPNSQGHALAAKLLIRDIQHSERKTGHV